MIAFIPMARLGRRYFESKSKRNHQMIPSMTARGMRMTTPVARASRETNGPNMRRSLTTHPKPQASSKFVVYAALVFVSAASGAVGSVVCQVAKLKGHTVIGSAGGAANPTTILLTSTQR